MIDGKKPGFKAISDYLLEQTQSSLCDTNGDDSQDVRSYQTYAVGRFFPVMARQLVVEYGLSPSDTARFFAEAALEALQTGGADRDAAKRELLAIVLAKGVSDEPDRE